jgi:hypothetical protein
MSEIARLCDRLVSFHPQIGHPLEEFLLPGLSDSEIDLQIAGLPFVVPDSLRDIYKWRNGIAATGENDGRFFESMTMYPLQRSVAIYRTVVEIREPDFSKNWFPILSNECADHWAVECSAQRASDAPVIIFMNELPNRNVAFGSVEQMLRTMIRRFEAGVFTLNGNWLDCDSGRFRKLARQMNPDAAKYWNDAMNPYGPEAEE